MQTAGDLPRRFTCWQAVVTIRLVFQPRQTREAIVNKKHLRSRKRNVNASTNTPQASLCWLLLGARRSGADWCITSSSDHPAPHPQPLPSLYLLFLNHTLTGTWCGFSSLWGWKTEERATFRLQDHLLLRWTLFAAVSEQDADGQKIELQRLEASQLAGSFCLNVFQEQVKKRGKTPMKTGFSPTFEGQALVTIPCGCVIKETSWSSYNTNRMPQRGLGPSKTGWIFLV